MIQEEDTVERASLKSRPRAAMCNHAWSRKCRRPPTVVLRIRRRQATCAVLAHLFLGQLPGVTGLMTCDTRLLSRMRMTKDEKTGCQGCQLLVHSMFSRTDTDSGSLRRTTTPKTDRAAGNLFPSCISTADDAYSCAMNMKSTNPALPPQPRSLYNTTLTSASIYGSRLATAPNQRSLVSVRAHQLLVIAAAEVAELAVTHILILVHTVRQ